MRRSHRFTHALWKTCPHGRTFESGSTGLGVILSAWASYASYRLLRAWHVTEHAGMSDGDPGSESGRSTSGSRQMEHSLSSATNELRDAGAGRPCGPHRPANVS